MSQSPPTKKKIAEEHPYAVASQQLNRLVRLGHAFSGGERNCLYLNTGDGEFANASGASQFDFADDGRAIAVCDWDFDGDLDYWVANRSAPQLRFLRNDLNSANHFLSIRLIGTDANRDGIGARLRVSISSTDEAPRWIMKTIRAGEGYLSQNSKWLHFGLGEANSIERMEIRWPGADWFPIDVPVKTDLFYELRQGATELTRWSPPDVGRISTEGALAKAKSTSASASLLPTSVVLPPLEYRTSKDALVDATNTQGDWVLLNIWASWCQPCLVELKKWNEEADRIRSAEVKIVAVSVDDLSSDSALGMDASKQVLERLGFQHESGTATPKLIEILQSINDTLIFRDDHRPLPVPTSLLIDRRGMLAAVYKGPVAIERVLEDVACTMESAKSRADRSVPFKGRWIAEVGRPPIDKLAARLWEAGFGSEALVLGKKLHGADQGEIWKRTAWTNAVGLRKEGDDARATEILNSLVAADANHVDALMELGVLAGENGDLDSAVMLLKRSVDARPNPKPAALFNLALAVRKRGEAPRAEALLKQAVKLDGDMVVAHELLGQIYAANREYSKAAESFAMASRLAPNELDHRFNRITAVMESRQLTQALELLDDVDRLSPNHPRTALYRGEAMLKLGEIADAVAEFRKVIKSSPEDQKLWFRIGQCEESVRNWPGALDAYRRLLKLVPNDPVISSRVAWVLAAAPSDSIRNGGESVALAESAARATDRKNPMVLDVLGAAYAETGEFAKAVRAAEEALKIVLADQKSGFASEIKARLAGYRDGVVYRLPKK